MDEAALLSDENDYKTTQSSVNRNLSFDLEDGDRPQDQTVDQLPRPASGPACGWIVDKPEAIPKH
jgi:hypothetical protein